MSSKFNHSRQRSLPVKPINYKEAKPMLQQIKVSQITIPKVIRPVSKQDNDFMYMVNLVKTVSREEVTVTMICLAAIGVLICLAGIWA